MPDPMPDPTPAPVPAHQRTGPDPDRTLSDVLETALEADVFVDNARGFRLVEKLGFRREGHLRRAVCKHGEWRDEYLYGVLPGELVAPAD